LQDDRLDSDESEETKCDHIESLIHVYGWENAQEILLNMLSDKERRTDDYQVIAEVIWGAILDNRTILEKDKWIALLHERLPKDKDSPESNLAWSIICKIKGINYLSEYDPMNDGKVVKYLQKESDSNL